MGLTHMQVTSQVWFSLDSVAVVNTMVIPVVSALSTAELVTVYVVVVVVVVVVVGVVVVGGGGGGVVVDKLVSVVTDTKINLHCFEAKWHAAQERSC